MKSLLDTQAFLWWITNSSDLSTKAREAIANEDAEVFFSVVTAWEIVIKSVSWKVAFT